LFHQRPHWQTINETARPVWILKWNTIPKPSEHDGGGFAKTGWNVDESRIAFRAAGQPFGFETVIAFATRKATLVVVGRRFFRGGLKKAVELKSAHGSPPSRRVDARCLVIDCLCKFDVTPRPNPRFFFLAGFI
jgi:hypothetical protein